MRIHWNKDGLQEFELGLLVRQEGKAYVAFFPALDLCTHGDTKEDAIQAGQEAARLFLQELINMGTADQVLSEFGWTKRKGSSDLFPYIPPEMSYRQESISI